MNLNESKVKQIYFKQGWEGVTKAFITELDTYKKQIKEERNEVFAELIEIIENKEYFTKKSILNWFKDILEDKGISLDNYEELKQISERRLENIQFYLTENSQLKKELEDLRRYVLTK